MCVCVCVVLTYITEQHWKEDQTMSRSEPHDSQVHPEVEDLEQLRLGEGENDDASQLRQGDSTQNLQGERKGGWMRWNKWINA